MDHPDERAGEVAALRRALQAAVLPDKLAADRRKHGPRDPKAARLRRRLQRPDGALHRGVHPHLPRLPHLPRAVDARDPVVGVPLIVEGPPVETDGWNDQHPPVETDGLLESNEAPIPNPAPRPARRTLRRGPTRAAGRRAKALRTRPGAPRP